MIDWSKLKTAEQLEQESEMRKRISITRTQGLVWMHRQLGVKDEDILARIDSIPDADKSYELQTP